MKTDHKRELIEAVQAGNIQRARDLRDLITGEAVEVFTFTDFIKNYDRNKRLIISTTPAGSFAEFIEKYGAKQVNI